MMHSVPSTRSPSKLQLDAQNPVCGRMLRPHVDDEFVGVEKSGFLHDLLVRSQYLRLARTCHSSLVSSPLLSYCPLSIPRLAFTQASSCFRMS